MNIQKLYFISKFCSPWWDIIIIHWWLDQTGVDQSPLGWEVVWKGAMWAEFQRYNAGMGRYQSTHWLYRPGPGPAEMPVHSLYSLSFSCQLVERWRVVSFGCGNTEWQGIYLTSEEIRYQQSGNGELPTVNIGAGNKVAKHGEGPSPPHTTHHHHHLAGYR